MESGIQNPSTRQTPLDRLYAKNSQTSNDICKHLGMNCQAVTQHLALLETANLSCYRVAWSQFPPDCSSI